MRAFELERHGASYRVKLEPELQLDNKPSELRGKLLWGLSPSDVQFGADGGAYVLDWVRGWEKTGQGRIWRVHDPATDAGAAVQETKKLLAEGTAHRSMPELVKLLGHADQRVRLAAQFTLVAQWDSDALLQAAGAKGSGVARLHALWALGQLARQDASLSSNFTAYLKDEDSEVRAQAARLLGESSLPALAPNLLPLLQDPEPRVRFFAAQALGKLHEPNATEPLLEFFRRGASEDPYLRLAGVQALSRCAKPETLVALAKDPSEGIRTAALLALRRQHRPEVAEYLQDVSPRLVLEAARAIHDEPIDEAMPKLAGFSYQKDLPNPLMRRAINAYYRTDTSSHLDALVMAALNSKDEATQLDALDALANWNTDLGRDRVLGLYRPLPPARLNQKIYVDLRKLGDLLSQPSTPVRVAAIHAVATLELPAFESELLTLVKKTDEVSAVRLAALQAMGKPASQNFSEAIEVALKSGDAGLVKEARTLAGQSSVAAALEQARAGLKSGKPSELQTAFVTLGDLKSLEADALLRQWLRQLAAGRVPGAAQLDLTEAAAKRSDPAVLAELAAWEKSRPVDDPLAKWSGCMEGGDAQLGRQVFTEKAEAACMRCHKFAGVGGDVGPDLAGIGKQHDRQYILRSIVSPNADIAPGYENVLLTLKDGNVSVGIKTAETAESYTLQPLIGGPKETIAKDKVAKVEKAPSPMPEGLADVLGARDLRNVVEFLATQSP